MVDQRRVAKSKPGEEGIHLGIMGMYFLENLHFFKSTFSDGVRM